MNRKILLTIIVLLGSLSLMSAQTQTVTFQVQSPDSTPVYVFGSWNWGGWPGTAMTPIGGGKYSATLTLASNTTHEFLYVNGASPVKEILNPAWTCTNGNATYTNRVLNLGSVDTAVCYTFATCTTCPITPPPTPKNVTFQVESPDSTPVYLIGSWNWASYPGYAMSQVGPGKYSVTIPLPALATYEYLFVNGPTPVKEILNPTWTCTNGNTQYTNRVLNLGNSDTAVCYTFATCNTCSITPPPPPVNVTFQVESPDSTPVSLIGSWNWASFPGYSMAQVAANKYSVTIPLPPYASYEFLYVNGATPTKEALNPAWPCTNGNATYTNRTLTLGGTDTAMCFTWNSCNTCTVTPPPTNINVTFRVANTDSTPVYVFGSWNNWSNWPGHPMTLNTTLNAYEVVLPLQAGTNIEYLFVNGTGPTKEVLDPMWPCTNGNSTYTNRVMTLGTADTSLCVEWEQCTVCGAWPSSVEEASQSGLSISMTDNYVILHSQNHNYVDGVEIFDLTGRSIYSTKNKVATNTRISVQLKPNTMYIVRAQNENKTHILKTITKQ